MINLPHYTEQETLAALQNLAFATQDGSCTFKKEKMSKIGSDFDTIATLLHQADLALQLNLSSLQHWQLLHYLDTLLLWNKAYNLTAIDNPREASIKHIVDCLAILPCLSNKELNLSADDLFDIGTGAGLPSVIIAICQPERMCTALDSNSEKIRFIKQVTAELGLKNVNAVASRIQQFDGKFNLITSRAFASLVDFVELGAPYLAENGKIISMKGKIPEEEIALLSKDWHIKTIPLDVYLLSDSRHIIYLEKK